MIDAGCAESLVTAAAEFREHLAFGADQARARGIVEQLRARRAPRCASARHSTASAPWPGAEGQSVSGSTIQRMSRSRRRESLAAAGRPGVAPQPDETRECQHHAIEAARAASALRADGRDAYRHCRGSRHIRLRAGASPGKRLGEEARHVLEPARSGRTDAQRLAPLCSAVRDVGAENDRRRAGSLVAESRRARCRAGARGSDP